MFLRFNMAKLQSIRSESNYQLLVDLTVPQNIVNGGFLLTKHGQGLAFPGRTHWDDDIQKVIASCTITTPVIIGRKKEGNVLFNDALNTFYLMVKWCRTYGKGHSDSERGNRCCHMGLLFPINSTIPQTGWAHTTAFVTPVMEHWLEWEIAQWVHPMKDRSDDPSPPWANALTTELHLAPVIIGEMVKTWSSVRSLVHLCNAMTATKKTFLHQSFI